MDKIIDVFDKYTEHLSFDRRLAKSLYDMQVGYVNKNEEHMNFFGGNLTGVHILRFNDKEYRHFFHDILKINPDRLRNDIHKLDSIVKNDKGEAKFKISSDLFNMSIMYVAHKCLTSDKLKPDERQQAALDALLLFNYRTVSAIITDWFHYPADPMVAQRTYESLSGKFLLKQLGSWQEVMEYRSKEIMSDTSPHKNTLRHFGPDEGIVYLINDSQSRVADMIKNIYKEYMEVHKRGERINKSSHAGMDLEGNEVFKDKTSGIEAYVDYLLSIISDEHTLIKKELLDIIYDVIPTAPTELVKTTLTWLSEHYMGLKADFSHDTDLFARLSITYCMNYIDDNNLISDTKGDLGTILMRLKFALMSSRSTSDELLELRGVGGNIITEATKRVNEQIVSSVRTATILYVFLRAYTKKHYLNK